ncbi:MAG: hypothetical protein IJ717_04770 [Treponema sp.]|nr:hypothetical protein [Treponema sp.]
MKRILILIVALMSSAAAVFASSYEDLLAKGKDAESRKEWIYALGYYYDAMNAENAGNEAEEKFDSLASEIAKGNPGYGKFNVFSMHDEWINLAKNFYKYFTEYCPYTIVYEDTLKHGEVDYKNRTANYTLGLYFTLSDKYSQICSCFSDGLSASIKDDWNEILRKDEFYFLIYPKLSEIERKYANLVREPPFSKEWNAVSAELENEIKRIYNTEKIAFAVRDIVIIDHGYSLHSTRMNKNVAERDSWEISAPAAFWWAQLSSWRLAPNFLKENSLDGVTCHENTLYDVQFEICDKNGKQLVKGTRQNSSTVYKFENITADIMTEIDSNEALIKPTGVFLNYGVLRWELFDNKKPREFLKSLPDVAIGLDKAQVISKSAFTEAEEAEEEREIAERKAEEERRIAERKAEEERQIAERERFIAERIQSLGIKNESLAKYIIAEYHGERNDAGTITIIGDVSTEELKHIGVLHGTKLDLSKATGLTEIPAYAFSESGFKTFILPEGIVKISSNAFGDIYRITLPSTLTEIEGDFGILQIDYLGTKKQWKSLKKSMKKTAPHFYSRVESLEKMNRVIFSQE